MANLTPFFSSSTFWLHLYLSCHLCPFESAVHLFIMLLHYLLFSLINSCCICFKLFFFLFSQFSIHIGYFLFLCMKIKLSIGLFYSAQHNWLINDRFFETVELKLKGGSNPDLSLLITVISCAFFSTLKLSCLLGLSHYKWLVHCKHFWGSHWVKLSAPFHLPFTCIKFHCYASDIQL